MGRTKLDDDRLEKILANLALGLSERDACDLAGITSTTLKNWKARARAAAEILPEDWPKLSYDELRACAEELGISLAYIPRSGRRGRVTREDLVRALRDRAQKFIDFLARLKAAEPAHKAKILTVLDDLAHGRAKMRRTRTTQTIEQPNGTRAIVTVEVVELPPDRMVATKILEMRWPEEFGRRGRGGNGAGADPSAAAREVQEAVQRMLGTVPATAGLLPEQSDEQTEREE